MLCIRQTGAVLQKEGLLATVLCVLVVKRVRVRVLLSASQYSYSRFIHSPAAITCVSHLIPSFI